ncbi:MAG: hypothetical protein ACP5G7_06635 [Anaerolineae bacterium]
MKRAIGIIGAAILLIALLLPGTTAASVLQDAESGWVLVDVIALNDGADYEERRPADSVYHHVLSYGHNRFSFQFRYIGPSDDSTDPPMVHGESITFEASFSEPPEVIRSGDQVDIAVDLTRRTASRSPRHLPQSVASTARITARTAIS